MTAIHRGNRAGVTDLTGAIYAARDTIGNTIVVSALANVNGVIIRRAGGSGLAVGSNAFLYVGGDILANGGAVAGMTIPFSLRDICVPPGQEVRISIAGAAYNVWLWYEVL